MFYLRFLLEGDGRTTHPTKATKCTGLEEAEVTRSFPKDHRADICSVNGTVVSSETCTLGIASTATATAS